jgi:hypothetical protein
MVKTTEEYTRRLARGVIRSFLADIKNLNWALGMIEYSGVRDQRLMDIIENFIGYGNPDRYDDLIEACRARYWI